MRLVVITREYAPVTPYYGGIGTRLAVLVPELARLGNEVHVLVPDGGRHEAERDGVRFHPIRKHEMGRLWPLTDARWGLAADRWLRERGPFDVVFAPEWGGAAWRYARHKRSGPLITNLTTPLDLVLLLSGKPRSRGTRVQYAIQRRLERIQTEGSDALLAISRTLLRWTASLWDIERIPAATLPNPVDVGRVRRLAAGKPPLGFPTGGPVVAFSGRLEPRKGVVVLVEAMGAVWKRFPDAHLVLAGHDSSREDGAMSERLRTLAGPLAKRMHFLGHLDQEQLFPALAAADVVTLPSLWEAVGNAALEAMAVGCALVLTSGSGFDEYCDHLREGILVPPGDSGALASALIDLLDDPEMRARLGSSAAARSRREHDSPVAVGRYAEFFEAVAAGG
jgi:glycogen(starch) synthase